MNRSSTMDHNDTHGLIASNKVEGTSVYSRAGDKLGSISHFMVSKSSGTVSYAVMSFGGFLGMGTDEYTLPWEKLEYNADKGGYVVDITKEQLDQAPTYNPNDENNRNYYEGVSTYYGSNTPTW